MLEQEQQLSILHQRASRCEQVEAEARQAAELGRAASKESKVGGEKGAGQEGGGGRDRR